MPTNQQSGFNVLLIGLLWLLAACGGSSSAAAKQKTLDMATKLSLTETDLMTDHWGAIDWPRPAYFRYYMTPQDAKTLEAVLSTERFKGPTAGKPTPDMLDDLEKFSKGKLKQIDVNPVESGNLRDGEGWLKNESLDIGMTVYIHNTSDWNVRYAYDGRPITGCVVVIMQLY